MWIGIGAIGSAMEERKCTELDCMYCFDRRIEEVQKNRRSTSINGKMLREGILPDSVTCNCLLQDLFNGHSREGKRKEGKRLLNEMLDLGFIPDLASYNRLMNGLSNGGSSHQHKGCGSIYKEDMVLFSRRRKVQRE
ncbi:Pentatricopeptide repeat-containing protein [Vitis vinifera]|uniref:Pentatricopeptide repeat-containing protein n=1 Tax=Vitis vinifera TaxID=29760 RepID=A0A438G7I0_VITVI|nr:Pentatricopeptide repeat-containing protein [Vitis vinifera]